MMSFKILFTVFIIGVISISCSVEIQKMIMKEYENSPLSEVYRVYHTVYKKTYDINSEEGKKREESFSANVKFMNENKSSYPFLEIDNLTDIPHEMWMNLNGLSEKNQ